MSANSIFFTQRGYPAPYYAYPQVPLPPPPPKITVPSNPGATLYPISATYPAPQQLVPYSLRATPALHANMYLPPTPQQMKWQPGYIVSPMMTYFPIINPITPVPNVQQNRQSFMNSFPLENRDMRHRKVWTDDDTLALLELTEGKEQVREIEWELVLKRLPNHTMRQAKKKWYDLKRHGIFTADDFLKAPSTKKHQHFEEWLDSNMTKDKSTERVTEQSDEYTVISWMDPSSSEEEVKELVEAIPEQIPLDLPVNLMDEDKFVASLLN